MDEAARDLFIPQPGGIDATGAPKEAGAAVSIAQAIREALKLPVPNLASLKTFFEALGTGAGLRTIVTLEPGETIIVTCLIVNVENKSATVAKKATFRIKSKAGLTNLETVVAKLPAGTTQNALMLAGPCVFAYTAVAKEAIQIEAEEEAETETRVSITYYTTSLTA